MTDFLYPFLEGNERDVDPLLADLAQSANAKAEISNTLRSVTLAALDADIEAAAVAMASRFDARGRLFVFGNGGSSTDAAGTVALFGRPPEGTPSGAAAREVLQVMDQAGRHSTAA